MENGTSAPDSSLALSPFDTLLRDYKLLKATLPKCEMWTRSYMPRGQVFKVSLFSRPFTDAEDIYLMNSDDLTDDVMEMLQGVNIPVFDAHGKRLL